MFFCLLSHIKCCCTFYLYASDFIVAPFFISLVNLFPTMTDIIKIMVDNRAQWDSLHNVVIGTRHPGDKEKLDEELGRWERRSNGFTGTVAPFLIANNASETKDDLVAMQNKRRKSVTILETIVEKSKV